MVPPFCISILKVSRKGQNSSSFIRIQCTLHDLGVPFSDFLNFYKLKRGELISCGSKFCKMTELFGPHFCISFLKVLRTQILRHSLNFNAFCMVEEYFSQAFKISKNYRWGTQFLGGNEFSRRAEFFYLPFCISNLKVLKTQILRHSLVFMASCMSQENFSHTLKFFAN